MIASNTYNFEWKKTPIWLRAILIIAFINFISFWIISVANGGDALNGKMEDGKFFVANHGRYTEVSRVFFELNRIQSISVWVTHSCALLGVVWFVWRRKEHVERKTLKAGIKYFPYASFDFVTTLSPAKLITVLHRYVVPVKERRNAQSDVHFWGHVNEKGFKCQLNTRYRNGFAPVAVGSFRSTPEGKTVIHVTLRPHLFTICWLVIWFSPLIACLIVGILRLPSDGLEVVKTLAQVSAVIFISWAITLILFWLDGKKIQPTLAQAIPCQTTHGH
jgi:hypothetical protein